jgi:tetratricopeptide (TPR) repeat protein
MLATLIITGCRIPKFEGPVSRSLATSRKLSHRGVNALEHGDPKTASTLLKSAVDACPADAQARRHYAEALWQSDKHVLALEQMNDALKLNPDDDTLHVRAGQMRLAVGDADGADREAAEALSLNPKSAAAWALRGQVAHGRRDLRKALNDFHRSLGYAPNDRDVLLSVAEVYRELGQPQRALIDLQSLADTYAPGEEPQRLLYLQALALEALSRPDEVAVALRTAMQRGPATAELEFRLAAASRNAGHYDEARQALGRALLLDPAHPGCRVMLEEMNVAQGMPMAVQQR